MGDLLKNGAVPPEEYARDAAFWTSAIRACFVFVTGAVIVVLLALGVWTARILTALQRVEQTIQRQTDVMTGGRAAD